MDNFAYFIIHYKKNIDRRNYIFNNFVTNDKLIHWLTDFDKEEIEDNLHHFYDFDRDRWEEVVGSQLHILIGHQLGLHPDYNSWPWQALFYSTSEGVRQSGTGRIMQELKQYAPRRLRLHEISVLLKHRAAYANIVQNDYRFGVVLEDDFLVEAGYDDAINTLITSDLNMDFIDIAGGAGLMPRQDDVEVRPGLFRLTSPRTRTLCGYLISNSLCRQIVELNLPLTAPCDWELTYFMQRFEARACWTQPTILLHGSETQIYESNNQ